MLLTSPAFFSQGLFDDLPVGVVVLDRFDRIHYWNQTMAELTGITPHQAEGELIFRWFPELESVALNARIPFYRPDHPIVLRVHRRVVPQGQILTFQTDEPPSLDPKQADFVSLVSHELRTPLTSIKGFVDTLLRSRQQLSEEQQVHFLSIIKNQADRLTRLVEDLLVMSKMQSGSLRDVSEGIPIAQILERTLENLAQKVLGHTIVWQLAPNLPKVWADRDRLEQIFTNLLDNACKYSTVGSTVTISGQVVEGNFLTVAIADQGIGINPSAVSQIFERFCRIDREPTIDIATIGLGLYITKSLVESLGGQIEVESEAGVGSTFTVWLPINRP